MASVTHPFITPEEYLERERKAETKSEYLNGEIFAMSGGTFDHAGVAVNFGFELSLRLKGGPCRVLNSDMRIFVSAADLYTYPDLAVLCGPPIFVDDSRDSLTNPSVIIEVLSPSTSNYDRGDKFALYRGLPSLMEYLTVAQDKVQIEQHTRQPTGQWLLTETKELTSVLTLPSLAVEIQVADIYYNVEFPKKGA